MSEIRSIYGELQSTGDYTTMDDETLFDRALYFTQLEQAGNLTPRALGDVQKILGRLVFELGMREPVQADELRESAE
jgi:hypothetical protein